MEPSVAIPEDLYRQAEQLAAMEQVPVEQYIVRLVADQIAWKRYSLTRNVKDERRFAGVQERMPDTDYDIEMPGPER